MSDKHRKSCPDQVQSAQGQLSFATNKKQNEPHQVEQGERAERARPSTVQRGIAEGTTKNVPKGKTTSKKRPRPSRTAQVKFSWAVKEELQAVVHQVDVHQADDHHANVHQAEVHRADVHRADVHQADVHQADDHQADDHQGDNHQGDDNGGEDHQGDVHQGEDHQAVAAGNEAEQVEPPLGNGDGPPGRTYKVRGSLTSKKFYTVTPAELRRRVEGEGFTPSQFLTYFKTNRNEKFGLEDKNLLGGKRLKYRSVFTDVTEEELDQMVSDFESIYSATEVHQILTDGVEMSGNFSVQLERIRQNAQQLQLTHPFNIRTHGFGSAILSTIITNLLQPQPKE